MGSCSQSVRRYRVRRFDLGRWFVAPEARDARLPGDVILECFRRHARGDFGDVSVEHFEANLDAIAEGECIVSVYRHPQFTVRLITEGDRSVTTLHLGEDY